MVAQWKRAHHLELKEQSAILSHKDDQNFLFEVETAVGTHVYMQQDFKTTLVITPADGETSWPLLSSSTQAKVQIQFYLTQQEKMLCKASCCNWKSNLSGIFTVTTSQECWSMQAKYTHFITWNVLGLIVCDYWMATW